MSDIQADFTGMKNMTCSKLINSAILIYCYAEMGKCVDFFSGIIHNLFLQ